MKAQIKLGETIAVLFVFFILLALGMIFYANIQRSTTLEKIQDKEALRAVEISQTIGLLPEFQCSEQNVITDNCVDKLKLEGLAKSLAEDGTHQKNRDIYYGIFGYGNIKVKQVYPDTTPIFKGLNPTDPNIKEILIYNNTPAGEDYDELFTAIPVTIFDPTQVHGTTNTKGKYYFGYIEVTLYI